jgi:hypothetical protein
MLRNRLSSGLRAISMCHRVKLGVRTLEPLRTRQGGHTSEG